MEGPIKPAWMRRRRKAITRHCLDRLQQQAAREARRQAWTPPLLQVMKHMVPSLLAFAALKYQGNSAESLFVENPIPGWCFLASTCVYWLAVGAAKQMLPITVTFVSKNHKKKKMMMLMLWRVAVASALISATSLVSIFLPFHVSLSLLAIWAPLPVIVLAWPVLKDGYDKLLQPGVKNVIDKIRNKVAFMVGGRNAESMPV